jgi:SPP1 family predicted phage head-tail adaptor
MGTIGSKRYRIRIESPNLVADGSGGQVPGVPPYLVRCVVAAYERPLTGKEALLATQLAAVWQSCWEIWKRSDVSVKDRIRYGARVVEIDHIDPSNLDETWLYGSEVQA